MHTDSNNHKESFLEHLGDAIRIRRLDLSLSQEQLGFRAGFHHTYIADIENGLRNIPLTTLLRVAAALQSLPSLHILAAEKAMNESMTKSDVSMLHVPIGTL